MLQLVLNSMHKYQPRIHIVKRPENGPSPPITDLEQELYKTFVYPEAIFTAVTAYQNQLVSEFILYSNLFLLQIINIICAFNFGWINFLPG